MLATMTTTRTVAKMRATPRVTTTTTTRRAIRMRMRVTRTHATQTTTNEDGPPPTYKPPDAIDLDGLKRETQRRMDRAVKKVGKATTKLREAKEVVDALMAKEDATAEELDACPDVDKVEEELMGLKEELKALNGLEEVLRGCKSVNSPKFIEDAYPRAAELEVNDAPPERPARVKKVKGPKNSAPRMPYWTFVSVDGIDIRVGRTSSDNDRVSCDPECRDLRDWWMHAAGCPGSHVVIRYTGEDLPKETMIDAAVLAAANSKANQVGRAPVSLVRCRQVSKPKGAKPGLVQLSGDVRTVVVNVKDEASRLERLMETKT